MFSSLQNDVCYFKAGSLSATRDYAEKMSAKFNLKV